MTDDLLPEAVERRQRGALRRNRLLATGLLVAMAGIFGASLTVHDPGFWALLVRAGAEAAVVGGLADWFAVTAVFRRPLGLPIPHTAIVPRNKDRIGEGLAHFVERNFLVPELLIAKLRQVGPAERLARWLGEPGVPAAVADGAVRVLPYVIRSLADPGLRDFVAGALGQQLREIEVAPLLGRGLALLEASGQLELLLDRLLATLHELIAGHEAQFHAAVAARTAWWVPEAIDRRIAKALTSGLKDLLDDLERPEGEARARLLAAAAELSHDLAVDPAHRERLETAKRALLSHPEMQAWLASAWDALRRLALDDLAAPASRTRAAVAEATASLGRRLVADAELRARLDGAVEGAALAIIVPWRVEIRRFIAEVVRSWDTRTMVARAELAIGGDLQYIRLTGTLVGALVGCVLFLLSRFAV